MPNATKITTPVSSRSGARVTGAYLQPLIDVVTARGLSLPTLAVAAGMAERALSPCPESLAAADYVHLLTIAAELTNDPHLGLHVGESVKLGTYTVYGLMLLSCQDFGQVLQQTLRYEALAHDLGRSDLHVDGATARYQWHSHFPEASRHLADSVFAGIRVFGNWLAGVPLPPVPIAFMHTAPDDCSEYLRLFGTMPVFGATINSASFDAALLSWPVPNADVGMYPVLQQHAEHLLKEKMRAQPDGSIKGQVRAAILANLAQDKARLPLIAGDLGLTQRTLQRKLAEANSSFQQVLDQTRHDLAKEYLHQSQLNLADIAFLLGYQEQSAFNHAFKSWFGISPGSYREHSVTPARLIR
jgi:AraC-like DNA-binding protein